MFLLTFVTLLIAFIGVYAQVLVIQTARLNAQHNGIAQTMQTWQSAAVSMAASIIKTNSGIAGYTVAVAATGCSLTAGFNPGAIVNCPTPTCSPVNDAGCTGGAPNYWINPPGGNPIGTGGTANSGTVLSPIAGGKFQINLVYNTNTNLTECVHLPGTCAVPDGFGNCEKCIPIYDIVDYQFDSVLFQQAPNTQNLVVTFVPAPVIGPTNPAPGFLSPTAGHQIGLTTSDLMQQLQQAGLPNYTYGTISVAGGVATLTTGGGFQYQLPGALAVAANNGAIAMVSSPDGF